MRSPVSDFTLPTACDVSRLAAGDFHLYVLRRGLVEEEGAFALRALMRQCVARKPGGAQGVTRNVNIVHLETCVMQARTLVREPGVQRMIGRQRFDQLEMRVAEIEVRQPDGAIVDDLGTDDGKPEPIAPDFEGVICGRNDDREVVETTKSEIGI